MRVMAIEISVPPAVDLVTAQEFVDHARLNGITVGAQPDLIDREVKAAIERAQHYCRRSFITQELRAFFVQDGACPNVLILPRPPIQSVTRITTDGADLDPADYTLEWGVVTCASPLGDTATVEYKAGYGDNPTDTPLMIREGVLEYATVLYEARRGERDEKYVVSAGRTLPAGVSDLWRPYQVELSG
jgi:uncharacterized phiE125 gp8 family phage protein